MTIKRKPKTKPKIKNAALKKAVDAVRFQSALARLINVKQQSVWSWLHETGVVPAEYVLAIEHHTGVSRHELRADIYPRVAA